MSIKLENISSLFFFYFFKKDFEINKLKEGSN